MKNLDVDDLARRYLAGETIQDIAESCHVTEATAHDAIVRAGVRLRTLREVRRLQHGRGAVDEDRIVAAYVGGKSAKAVAEEFGASRPLVVRVLRSRGVPIRGRSETMVLRMAAAGPEGRLALSQASQTVTRGVPQSEEHRCKIALCRQYRPKPMSKTEAAFAYAMLQYPEIFSVREKAVGRYNVDFAITESSVAVELFGGNWHAAGESASRYRKRLDYVLDRGWLPLVIWITAAFPLGQGAIDYVVSLHERRRQGEAFGRQEHVIRGDGYRNPIFEGDTVSRPRIPRLNPRRRTKRDYLRAGQ